MNEIVSTIVANGIWAVLFCGLLVYELKDSRRRESRYTSTIAALSEKLGAVNDIKEDTAALRAQAQDIKTDTEVIKAGLASRAKKGTCGQTV